MRAYINATEAISAQDSFQKESLEVKSLDTNYYSCVEPVYKTMIPPAKIRRMSKAVKMGVATALSCHSKSEVDNPDAIVVGTGLGCVKDTEKFLAQIIENKESLLNPTSFIQSTHDTVSGQIALLLKCHAYNFTFSQERFSFENALLESLLLLEDEEAKHILLGGIDEICEESYSLMSELDCVKTESKATGHIPGEGAAFFALSKERKESSLAQISGMQLVYASKNIEAELKSFLASKQLDVSEIDMVLTGRNGEKANDQNFDSILKNLFQNTPCVDYKRYCGEYDTSSSFALCLATSLVSTGAQIEGEQKNSNTILIYNQDQNHNHSFILVSKC